MDRGLVCSNSLVYSNRVVHSNSLVLLDSLVSLDSLLCSKFSAALQQVLGLVCTGVYGIERLGAEGLGA